MRLRLSGSSAGPVLDDDALGTRLGGAGLAHRFTGRQPGGVDGTDRRHRQHGGGKHIDAKVLLLDHVEFLFWVMDRTNTAAIIP